MRLAVPAEIDARSLASWRRDAAIVSIGGETMGTTWRVKIAAPGHFDICAIQAAIEARLEEILAQMSHWRADSVLGRYNRAAPGSWTTLPPDFAHVLSVAVAVSLASGGAFDPCIGALVDAWGHGPVPAPYAPTDRQVESALEVSGLGRLTYDGAARRIRQPGGLRLDLSGIAKGFAVDALATLLAQRGCDHFLVEIGGELVGRGLRPDGDPWWVDCEAPAAQIPGLRVALHQLAIATSGDYVRGHHTIDPRSGRPCTHGPAMTVIHSSAMLADAWATALGVLDDAAMQKAAAQENLAVRSIRPDGGAFCEWISPALAEMIVVTDEPA